MSIGRDIGDGAERASPLLARAAAAQDDARHRLSRTIGDFFLPDDARLDDRTRVTLGLLLTALIALVEDEVRRRAARTLGPGDVSQHLAAGTPVLDRLIASGVLRDPAFLRELLARTRQDLLADALPAALPDEPGAPSLLARLTASSDGAVAKAALALMAAQARRRGFLDTNRLTATELPADLHHRLVWWATAAIRDQLGSSGADRALTDAALRCLADHDENDRVEVAAARLAAAIDAQPDELATLLIHAIGDREIALFAGLLGAALRIDFATMREIVIDRDAALWVALRAVDLDRPSIARLGLALAPDIEAFADQIDAIMAVTPDVARGALARQALHPDFRAALDAIEPRR